MKNLLNKLINPITRFKKGYIDGFQVKSYSQDGEDIILREFLQNDKIKNGFYIDIGAHHPKRLSNTQMFYKMGWSGINIDPLPNSMKLFQKHRKRDINLEIGISINPGKLKYYMFNEPALNGFSDQISKDRDTTINSEYEIINTLDIETYSLKDILDKYLPDKKNIDFMNIDVEGLDFEVLKSNDWTKYKPSYLLVEIYSQNIENILKDEIYLFLKKQGYSLIARTYRTCIFKIL
jgi:FkbM family methyltransferase